MTPTLAVVRELDDNGNEDFVGTNLDRQLALTVGAIAEHVEMIL